MIRRRSFYIADSSPVAAPWMITFSDLCLLLVSFFVLLLSMSKPPARAAQPAAARNPNSTAVFDLLNRAAPNIPIRADGANRLSVEMAGAFPSGTDGELSFRGQTTIIALARVAAEMSLGVELIPSQINSTNEISNWDTLTAQGLSAARQMVDTGIKPSAISVQVYDTAPPRSSTVEPVRTTPAGGLRVNLDAGE